MLVEIYYIMKVVFQISRETVDYVIIASDITTCRLERNDKAGLTHYSLHQSKFQINI